MLKSPPFPGETAGQKCSSPSTMPRSSMNKAGKATSGPSGSSSQSPVRGPLQIPRPCRQAAIFPAMHTDPTAQARPKQPGSGQSHPDPDSAGRKTGSASSPRRNFRSGPTLPRQAGRPCRTSSEYPRHAPGPQFPAACHSQPCGNAGPDNRT